MDTQRTSDPPVATELSTSACWALLRTSSLGRLAVTGASGPDIFPLNFVVDHGTVIFRSGDGTKIAALTESPDVAFEIDGYDAPSGQVFSVVVKGRAEQIRDLYEGLEALALPLTPWQGGPKHHFVRIVPTSVTGRAFATVGADRWRNPLTDTPAQPAE